MEAFRPRRSVAVVAIAAALAALMTACSGTAADPGTLVVLAHAPSGEVRFMQIGSGRITDRLRIGGEPQQIVRDIGRGRVYVTDRAGDSVAVVDVVARTMIKRVPVGREPRHAVISPDGKRLYVLAAGENMVAIVNLESLETESRVPTGNQPAGLAVSSDGGRVYVANDGDGSVVMIDANAQRRSNRPISVPSGLRGGVALSNDGTTLLTGAAGKPSLVAITLASRNVRDVSLGASAADSDARAGAVFSTPDGKYWLVGLDQTSAIASVPTDGSEPASVKTDSPATGFASAPGGRVLVASKDGEDLLELDVAKSKITRRIRVGPGHTDVAVFSKASLDALRGS